MIGNGRVSWLVAFAAACAVLVGCERGAPQPPAPPEDKGKGGEPGKDPDKGLADGGNRFALDLYQRAAAAADPGGNVVVSPLGLTAQFALATAAARGKTADELAAALRLSKADNLGERFEAFWATIEKAPRPPYRIGVRVAPPAAGAGAMIAEVYPDTPAKRAGLEPGDVILQVDEEPVPTAVAFANAVDRPGPTVDLKIRDARNDVRTFRLRLTPPDKAPAEAGRGPRVGACHALWHPKGLAVRDEFRKTVETKFRGSVRELDADPKVAAARVNKWIGDWTSGLLTGGVQPTDLADEKALLLTGAVWFEGAWADPFDKDRTTPDSFHVTPQKAVKVPFLNRIGDYTVGKGDGYQTLELPYRGGTHAMHILLPDAGASFKAAEAVLGKPDLGVAKENRRRQATALALPRFDVAGDLRLRESLAGLGVRTAFGADADFTGLTDGPLRLADVTHRARVRVDEDGTSAGAVTVMHVGSSGGPPPVPFQVNRPFLFVIRDTRTGALLFVGRVSSPVAPE